MEIELNITPVPKPRMTKADAWKKRPVVLKYWAFADELRWLCKEQKITNLPDVFSAKFVVPMPKSWSKKKKDDMDGEPHKQKPDLDNFMKAVKDVLCKEDSYIWKYDPSPEKRWGREGKIILYL